MIFQWKTNSRGCLFPELLDPKFRLHRNSHRFRRMRCITALSSRLLEVGKALRQNTMRQDCLNRSAAGTSSYTLAFKQQ